MSTVLVCDADGCGRVYELRWEPNGPRMPALRREAKDDGWTRTGGYHAGSSWADLCPDHTPFDLPEEPLNPPHLLPSGPAVAGQPGEPPLVAGRSRVRTIPGGKPGEPGGGA